MSENGRLDIIATWPSIPYNPLHSSVNNYESSATNKVILILFLTVIASPIRSIGITFCNKGVAGLILGRGKILYQGHLSLTTDSESMWDKSVICEVIVIYWMFVQGSQ